MASQLPGFPRLVFTVLEPISLLAGWLPAAFSPAWFLGEQLPEPLRIEHTTDHSIVVTRQLGNCYLLAFLVGVAVLYSTNEIKVVRNYLVALWIADITHVLTTALALGYEGTVQVRGWNPTTWGNIGATVSTYLPAREAPGAIRERRLCLEPRADGGYLDVFVSHEECLLLWPFWPRLASAQGCEEGKMRVQRTAGDKQQYLLRYTGTAKRIPAEVKSTSSLCSICINSALMASHTSDDMTWGETVGMGGVLIRSLDRNLPRT
jgi:hypothetical protein